MAVQSTLIELRYKCGCTTMRSQLHLIFDFGGVELAREVFADERCNTCDQARRTALILSGGVPLSPEEETYYEQAWQLAQAMRRPFTDREVLSQAWEAGWEMDLEHDPSDRYVLTGERDGVGERLWIVK